MSTAWMGLYGPKIADQGYRIVPIKPGTKRPTEKRWERFGHHQDDVDIERFVRDTPQWGIGILTAFNPAVDIDVRDPTLALQLQEQALTMLGAALVRIGAHPKRLLPYRTDKPFAKVASRGFRLPGDRPGDKPHRIEVLADGQQFVAYAIHPDTGRPYQWLDGGPLDVAHEDLTLINQDQVRAYLREAERLILEAGGRPEAQFADDPGPRKTNANLIAPYDLVADAMRHVPNHDVHYDDWVTVGLAIKAAVGEAGCELFHGYSRQSLKYDGEVTERAWKSFQPERIGAGSIFHWAKKHGGWTRPPSAASRSKAEDVSPYWGRPTMDAPRASRRLRRIAGAFFNEVDRHNRCRDRIDQLTAERSGTIPDGLSEDARSGAERRIRRWAIRSAMREFKLKSSRAPRVQIKAPAGLGKSSAIRDIYLNRPELWGCHIHVYVPDLRLAEAIKQAVDERIAPGMAHKGRHPRAVVMYGRTHGMEVGRAKCLRPDPVQAAQGKVSSIYEALCSNGKAECPLIARCQLDGYLAQFGDRGPALRIFPHVHLGLERPEDLRLPRPDLVIIDESCIDAVSKHLEVPLEWLGDWRVYGRLLMLQSRENASIGTRVADAIRADGPTMKAILSSQLTVQRLYDAAAAARQAATAPDIRPDTPPEIMKLILANVAPARSLSVAAALEQLGRDLEAGREQSIGVEYVAQHDGTLDGRPATFPALLVHRLRDLSLSPKTPLCLIDADADQVINEAVFGPLRCFELPVRRRGHVIQCNSSSLAKSTLLQNDRELGKIARLVSRKASERVYDVGAGVWRPNRVLVVMNKPVRRKVTGETADRLELAGTWQGAEVTHFGAFLGQNRWEKFDVVIVVGREQIPALAAERMARAVYANSDVKLNLTGSYVKERRGFDLRDGGSAAAEVWRHPDDRVQTFVEFKREHSMGQAIDRLRLLHLDGRLPEIIVLCNVPLPSLVVDYLMSLDDICDGGTPVARAFRETAGAMPLVPATLARRHADLFMSDAAAESALRREDLETVKKQIVNPNKGFFRLLFRADSGIEG